MVGAVKRAVGSFSPAIDTLLDTSGFNCIGELEEWNDAPERTQAEVLEAFDKAIAECGE